MAEAIARVHVDDFDPEVYSGEGALETALRMANVYRDDFPGATVGVSYNPQAAEDKKRDMLARVGLTPEELVTGGSQ